ncbi:similar to Saccharomyces cerevisiae YJR032W CPR7 Peptidyl-prolyl cis-trans isomerase (cyclophilin), catalyzes the cis-trans isomerization of peptide bonds N-terminal to proline residues [Maudiozyma barnettii]|uniref:peptidylprolyl isomerase n=1 Tax=Maudiozyma barnettii TaxID=61262 RepID=A0A8H2VFL9_9SACH|nr:peptidylprolyl isomerase CPR7 [Kazachstania barnettii]CAB4254675.1 similar to Saccharomyces cerevisiae YJR032W CPR7 Peptidyl-prolyl cis-trans isomerase (cyclophilin), catalyzes the cis-trans isomerization of peptide bonds N-terminal to proline residues [Kazachstania barnettii]CAD1782717.1 similar to Saccharomyces cerevisiae YJR032W CPR7 Peptidyl-prolyl cis-trans isomerase (cyclophilin), catalyzes the cis-trans isomerization of peptide bonds N-terminal to proline residues [Kazachstania barnetti
MSEKIQVFFDISIEEQNIGRIVFELFKSEAPLATENFLHLCRGDLTKTINGEAKQLTYKNNFFHRIVKTFMIQAGDIIYGSEKFEKSDDIGKGGCSIYATDDEIAEPVDLPCYGKFRDENLGEFTEPFYLAMVTTGEPDSNTSQFFIMTGTAPHLNNKHTIFGKVIHGKSVVRTVEHANVDSDGFPEKRIRISECGEWNNTMPIPLYNASNNLIGGDIYEEYPDDDKTFDPEDFNKAYEAAFTIKESGSQLFRLKDFQNSFFKYKKSLNYINMFIPEGEVDKENNLKFLELKTKVYLNLSLLSFNLKNIDGCITYAKYALESPGIENKDKAKAYYRIGNAYLNKKAYDDALTNYNLCKENNPDDKVIDVKIVNVENIIEQNKERTKKNIAKFFS